MANGALVSQSTAGGKTTWVWREAEPMAPYLATTTLGKFDLTITKLANGITSYVAIDPQLAKGQVLSKLPEAVALYSSIYGPYPFSAVGAIVDSAKVVGDSLTITRWPDIWLHEGFATWSEWIWSERQGNKSAHQWFEQLYNTPAQDTRFWGPAVDNFIDPALLFNGTVYYRGGMTLQALREKIGDLAFFQLLRDWAAQNRYGNVTTPQFIALAEKESGMDLTQFFKVWIYQDEKPAPGSW